MNSHVSNRQSWFICLALAAITCFVFAPALNHEFISFDDPTYVTSNPGVQDGLTVPGIAWAFTTGHGGNWHPLTWLSHMLDCDLYGLKPAGHHLTNLLFHVANTLLLFSVLRLMTGAVWRSALVAALFAWHPLHVESVAWVAERKDVLSTFFWLLTMLAYAGYVREFRVHGSRLKIYYRLTLLLFVMGLMAKPMLVTLPFVLLLTDYWPLQRSSRRGARNTESAGPNSPQPLPWKRLIIEKWPFFLLSAVSCVITFIVQKKGGAVAPIAVVPVGPRSANALLACVAYLRKMIWPSDLAIFYPYPRSWSVVHLAAAILLLALISAMALAWARRRPYFLVGWLWFLGTLVPVLGLVQVGGQSMADRYTYMPLVGIFIILAWGAADLLGRRQFRGLDPAWPLAVFALAVCVVAAINQLGYWQNSETLFRHAVDVTSNNIVAHNDLAQALDREGKSEAANAEFVAALKIDPDSAETLNGYGSHFARRGDLDDAVKYFTDALRRAPFYGDAHFNLANALAAKGQYPEAADHYTRALRSGADGPDVRNNLGAVLVKLGRLDEAVGEFKAALRQKPKFPEAQEQLADVLLKQGYVEAARIHFAEALRLNPDSSRAHFKIGLIDAQQGNLDLAIGDFLETVKLQPTNAGAYYNLACAYAVKKDLPKAADAFAQAIQLKPDNADAHSRLGAVFAEQRRFDDAVKSYREALRLKSDDAETQGRFAAVLAVSGDFPDAVSHYREALRLRPDWPGALRDLAWILATNPRDDLRNGPEAVRLARRSCELTKNSDARFLSALDAAYAEAGRFDDAIKTAEQVRQLRPLLTRKPSPNRRPNGWNFTARENHFAINNNAEPVCTELEPFLSQQFRHLRANVALLHQGFAHQNRARPAFPQPLDIGAGMDAALRDE